MLRYNIYNTNKTVDKTPFPSFHMSLSAAADPFVPSSAANVPDMLESVVLQLVVVAGASDDGLTAHAREKEIMRVSYNGDCVWFLDCPAIAMLAYLSHRVF